MDTFVAERFSPLRRRTRPAFLFLCAVVAVYGCGTDDATSRTAEPTTTTTTAPRTRPYTSAELRAGLLTRAEMPPGWTALPPEAAGTTPGEGPPACPSTNAAADLRAVDETGADEIGRAHV